MQLKFNVNIYEALIKSRTILKFRHTFFKSVSKRGHVRAKEDVWLPYRVACERVHGLNCVCLTPNAWDLRALLPILSRILTVAVQQKRRRGRRGPDVDSNGCGTVQRRITNVLDMQIWSDLTGKYYPPQWRVKWHNSPATIQIHPQMAGGGC